MRLSDKVEFEVIRRAGFGFRNCGPGRAASLLIDRVPQVKLPIFYKQVETRFTWKLELQHQETGKRETISTSNVHSDLEYIARVPGTYEIVNVQGEYCEGVILSPETCQVVEQPLPRLNITWQELHEW